MLTFAEQHVQGDEDHIGRHRGELLVARQLLQDTHTYATAVLDMQRTVMRNAMPTTLHGEIPRRGTSARTFGDTRFRDHPPRKQAVVDHPICDPIQYLWNAPVSAEATRKYNRGGYVRCSGCSPSSGCSQFNAHEVNHWTG